MARYAEDAIRGEMRQTDLNMAARVQYCAVIFCGG